VSYLIGTDAVADWLNNRSAAVSLLTTLEPEGLAVSIITTLRADCCHGAHARLDAGHAKSSTLPAHTGSEDLERAVIARRYP
jgi:hypothetical protein